MSLVKLRLGFLFTDLSQHFGMHLVVFALKLFYSLVRGDSKSCVTLNQKLFVCIPDMETVLATTPKIYS